MLVRCTACSTVLTVPDDGGGRLFRCPACATTIRVGESSNPSIPALALGDEGMVPPLEASPTMTDIAALDDLGLNTSITSGGPTQLEPTVGSDQTVVDVRLQADAATLSEAPESPQGEGAFRALGSDTAEATDAGAVQMPSQLEGEGGDGLDLQADGQASIQAGSQPPMGAGSQPPAPAGSQPPTPVGSQPPTPAGSQPPTPAGSQPPMPAGSQPPAQVSNQSSAPPGSQPPTQADGQNPGQVMEQAFDQTEQILPPEEISGVPSNGDPVASEGGLPAEFNGPSNGNQFAVEPMTETMDGATDASPSALNDDGSDIRGGDDEIKVSAADVTAEREAKKAAVAKKKSGRIFSEGGTGLLLVFLTGITLGGAGVLTFKEMELNEIQAERARERRVQEQWKPVLDAARKQDEEQKLRLTRLRVHSSTRALDIRTAQQVGKVGFSGLNQAVVAGKDGTRYRAYWGRLTNGRSSQIDAVRVVMEWAAPLKRGGGVQLDDRRGQANSLAFGHCPSANLKCLDRRPVFEVGDLVAAANIQDAKALVLRKMAQPGVSTTVQPGGSIPFLLYEVADNGQQIDDAWLGVQLIEEAMPDRRYGRTKARKGKGKRRRRMRSRRRRQGR